MVSRIPRLLIAGLSGDSGKTIASLSLLAACRQKGLAISVFKKGPDYIDAAWLTEISGARCRNLDTFMVGEEAVKRRFARHVRGTDLALIEGNRGIFDGKDVDGTHSTASLAKLLGIPVVLVVDATKSTRTLAALVHGCISFDPQVRIGGIILNRVAGARHEKVARQAIEKYCDRPVLGVIPKLVSADSVIPGRHLGLVTPAEFTSDGKLVKTLQDIAADHLDVDRILELAGDVDEIEVPENEKTTAPNVRARIGFFRDSVFTFYYPENLEALEAEGAELVALDSMADEGLPADLDGLYIGGGFPETQVEFLVRNRSMMESVRRAAESGMPVYAECGGLIYLSRSLESEGTVYPMAGVFPVELSMRRKPVGHGYAEFEVDADNPFFDRGTVARGHEFHYSGPTEFGGEGCCLKVNTGVGLGQGRDGLLINATVGSYIHIHADGVPGWAPGFVKAAAAYGRSHTGVESDLTDGQNAGGDSDSMPQAQMAAGGANLI